MKLEIFNKFKSRKLLTTLFALAIVGIIAYISVYAKLKPTKKYNVLFIAVDDLNDWIGCYGGHPQAYTPNLDRLAASGLVFDNAHCAASVCNASRVAIMSGFRPATTGIYDNNNYMRASPILKDAKTLPQYFAQKGYSTMARGKIFHQANGKWADTKSWNTYLPTAGKSMNTHPMQKGDTLFNGMPFKFAFQKGGDWGIIDEKFHETTDAITAQWAADLLQTEHEKPFFIACGIYRPHLPWFLPKEFFDKFPLDSIILPEINENDLEDIPPIGQKMSGGLDPEGDYQRIKRYNKQKEAVQAYLAAIYYADSCIGILLDALESSKYKDNTIVVLWGDHGWHLGEKLHYRKFVLWEESTRVPLLIRVPGVTKAGQRCQRPVNLLDLYPTLSELCDLPVRVENEGKSIVPLLFNPQLDWQEPTLTTMGYKRHALRSERWRFIQYEDGSEELYDHSVDSLEWNNLAGDSDYDSVKIEMRKHLPKINLEPQGNDINPGDWK